MLRQLLLYIKAKLHTTAHIRLHTMLTVLAIITAYNGALVLAKQSQ